MKFTQKIGKKWGGQIHEIAISAAVWCVESPQTSPKASSSWYMGRRRKIIYDYPLIWIFVTYRRLKWAKKEQNGAKWSKLAKIAIVNPPFSFYLFLGNFGPLETPKGLDLWAYLNYLNHSIHLSLWGTIWCGFRALKTPKCTDISDFAYFDHFGPFWPILASWKSQISK